MECLIGRFGSARHVHLSIREKYTEQNDFCTVYVQRTNKQRRIYKVVHNTYPRGFLQATNGISDREIFTTPGVGWQITKAFRWIKV